MQIPKLVSTLCLGTVAFPLTAQATRKMRSIDQAERKAPTASARAMVQRELMGIEPEPKDLKLPDWFDVNLAATLVFGKLPESGPAPVKGRYFTGTATPIGGSLTQEWLLVCSPLDDRGESSEPSNYLGVVRLETTAQGLHQMRVMARSSGNAAPEVDLPPDANWGVADDDSSGHFMSQGAAWLTAGKGKRLLSVPRIRMEGYAGGGATFVSTLLFRIDEDDQLKPVAHLPQSADLLLAGNWNTDGTREHHASSYGWRIQVLPESRDGWSSLKLVPTTPKTRGMTLRWNAAQGGYQ